MPTRLAIFFSLSFASAALLSACAGGNQIQATAPGRLRVIATTNILGDVVQNVAGEAADVTVLLPPGADPHSFEPTPQEVAAVARADLVFANGLGLEIFLERLIQNAAEGARMVTVSEGIIPLEPLAEQVQDEHALPESGDPHVWMDPHNVLVWAENIAAALGERDPANASAYLANAAAYQAALLELDGWIARQVESIPPDNRELVTDHLAFTYYARRYGLSEVGAVAPATSTLAEPSAQELAALEDAIRSLNVQAIFYSSTVNPTLARRIAADSGVELVQVYTSSLSEPGGPAEDYLMMMRYNTNAIVQALR